MKLKMRISSLRIPIIIVVDMLLTSLSFFITYSFLSQGNVITHDFFDVLLSLGSYVLITSLSLVLFGCYRREMLEKATDTVLSVFVSAAFSQTVCALLFQFLPLFKIKFGTGIFITGSVAVVLIILCHILQTILKNYYMHTLTAKIDDIPTLIIGAGFTGKMVYHELISEEDSGLNPVCFVDDDKDKISTKICGLNVYGPIMLLP
ncbi:MAG: hypothetical protein U0M60_05050, partial [Clostridia bacterium]|nr:hypothetical protein [Clostridia bacterium]